MSALAAALSFGGGAASLAAPSIALAAAPVKAIGSSEASERVSPGLQVGPRTSAPDAQGRYLVVVRFREDSLAAYDGGVPGLAATSARATGASQLDVRTPASVAYLDYLRSRQADHLAALGASVGRNLTPTFQYLNVLNAAAVRLTLEEANKLASLPEVRAVFLDEEREPATDAGPAWIGAPSFWNGDSTSGDQNRGEGVIVGIIDSGVNHDHPSFAQVASDGYVHINPNGDGVFLGDCLTDVSLTCNNKLFGSYDFHPTSASAEDTDGHGSHVASTAAGNPVATTYNGLSVNITGVAPRANIINYKVCSPTCPQSSSAAAVDQAITDGANVLNFSISGSDSPWNDFVDLAFLDATEAGIFVTTAAGNDGPGASTSAHSGPWNAAVGNSSHNRVIGPGVDAAGFTDMVSAAGTGPALNADLTANLLDALVVAPANPLGCNAGGGFPAGAFTGAIAFIQRGDCAFAEKVANATAAGAVGVLTFNNAGGPPIVMGGLEASTIPAVMIDRVDGLAVRAALPPGGSSATISAVQIRGLRDSWGDVMATGSSRGPSQFDVLKPDYAAPGTNILAAFSNGVEFEIISGTSMASPHATGAAALLKAEHPTWTPAQIKSAIALTADPDMLKEDGNTPADPFDRGSGRVDITQAARVGAVLDETADNFEAANPGAGGDPRTLNLPSLVDSDCAETCTFTRTLTSVAPDSVNYTVSAVEPPGVTIDVTPASFSLAAGADQELTIEVTVDTEVAAPGAWTFGSIALVPEAGGTPLPLVEESFTDATFPPVGWSRFEEVGTGTTAWIRVTTAASINSAPGGAQRIFGSSTEGNQIDWLVSPPINLGDGSAISFFERVQWPEDYGKHSILVSTDSCVPADGDFVELAEVGNASNNLWRQVSFPMGAYDNQTVCVAFKYEGDFASTWFVDDIAITAQVGGTSDYSTLRMPVAITPQLGDPAISVTPTTVDLAADQGETVTQPISIANVGGAPLEWNIQSNAARGNVLLSTGSRSTPVQTAPLGDAWREARLSFNKGYAGNGIASPAPVPSGTAGITISHSTSMTPAALTAVACSPDSGVTTSDNQFLRTFALNDFGITDAFDVSEVTIGVEQLDVEADVTINLYTLTGAFTYANLTPIGTTTQTLQPQDLTNVTIPVTGTVPANGTLVVEIVPPDLSGVGAFFPGANSAGQTAPSYLASAGCGLADPATYASIGFPQVHLTMSVTSNEDLDCGVNGDATWATASPTSGTVDEGQTGGTTLAVDASDLAPGSHSTNLCIASNDPSESVVVVPVSVDVTAAPVIELSDASIAVVVDPEGTTTYDLDISNVGDATLDWSVDTAAPESGPTPFGAPSVLFDNGSIVTHPGAGAGGADASALQTGLGMDSYGGNISVAAGFRMADDFTVTDAGGWALTSLRFYGYQTGSTTTSTFNAVNVRIWDGVPGAPGSNIVYGDTTTNLFSGTGFSGTYRVLDTGLTNNQRPVMYVDAAVDVELDAGTYWLDWQLGGTLGSGPWQPPITILGETTTGNAQQFTGTAWQAFIDGDPSVPSGTLTPQGAPFQLSGSVATQCTTPTAIPWLTIAPPTSGSLEADETDTVTLNFDSTGLAEGSYDAQVCVSSNDAGTPLIGVPVNMIVGDVPVPATIDVTPASLSATVDVDATLDQTLTISNSGTEDLTWSIVDTDTGPASVEYRYGLSGGGTHPGSVAYDRASGLAPTGPGQRVVHPAPQGGPIAELSEGFDDVTLLAGAGWGQINNSSPIGTIDWFQGGQGTTFPGHQGGQTSYIAANFNNTAGGTGTISNWLLTPELTLTNGTELRFWTRSTGGQWADRLEVRLSTAGASTDVGTTATSVGDFGTVLLTINESLTPFTGYPAEWTEFVVEVSGLPAATTGRFGFRYFVTQAGPTGTNSDFIGIDTLSIAAGGPPPASCDAPADLPWLSVAPASGTTAGESSDDVTVTYDATGLAAGTYEGTLCVASNDAVNPLVEVPVEMTVADLTDQTITFDPLPDVAITAGTVTVSATASSGLPVSFSSDTPAVCTVAGNTVTLVTVGTCSIRASQAGNGTFAPAPDVVQSFEVFADVDVVITPATVPNAQIDTPYSVTFTASGAGSTTPFTYTVSAGTLPPGLTLDGATGELSGTPTALGTFDFTITATDSTPAGSGGPFTGSQDYTIVVRDEFIFADGFEDEALTKLEIGGAGAKIIELPMVNAFADQADGRTRNVVALTVHGKRVGVVQMRCDAKACEVRVANRKADATWNQGTWWLVDSDPFQVRVNVGAKLLKDVSRPGKH
ncbi:choice-of-anchor J domain-containing protein [Chiayiivirga flava]|uniref:MAM domain-containing protein n=1 Tax=Chiayiivirga flava TaxID=659595 RepID=A0A7W8G374_9GAMM|nr:choice-of-anchor J domain-containing protein [Chiayiivirga flava]MBB5209465.1 hypothetical protein [Chiayiivirga flava]